MQSFTFLVLLYPTTGDIFADFDSVVHQLMAMHKSARDNSAT